MPHTTTIPLKQRKEQERQREQTILRALKGRKKDLESRKRDRQHRKKGVGELLALLNVRDIAGAALRPVNAYVPRSYNLDKQLYGLLDHLYVRYRVPAFLYECCIRNTGDPFEAMHDTYRQWFLALAQGGSFPRLVKDVMTSREAFVFLSGPAGRRIHENVWWAKMRVAGLSPGLIERLIERIFAAYFVDDPGGRLAEVIQFYARYHGEMDRATFDEVTDFLAWKLRNDRAFRLKGRTAGSVIKLTHEWHALMQKARLDRMVEWTGLGLPDWEFEGRDRVWAVRELRTNRELMNEGRKQRHCVYSYVSWCVAGRSAIFSLRACRKIVADYRDDGSLVWDWSQELTRVTIEVNSQRAIVQVRGHLNRPPTDDEKRVLRMWAGAHGLTSC